ncbi:MAG: orotate phosphoribosyltransferase [Promethearchaeota archaeon]|jgi:orotate phosphoribosyltransferase
MNESKEEIINSLEQIGALKYGEFILASGAKSNYYIDLRIIPNYPEVFARLISLATQFLIDKNLVIEGVVGIPLAGIPFGTMIATQLNKPFYILRKEPKDHGLKKMIEGQIKKGQKILLVDDLISSGFSKIFAINALRDEGARVDDLFVVVNRVSDNLREFEKENSIKIHFLVEAKDILKTTEKN